MNRDIKKKILYFLVLIGLVLVPVSLSKYTTTYSKKIHLKVRKPQYTVVFYENAGERLPSGYQEVEYIESNGTQYIDTGVKPTLHTDISLKCYVPFNSSNIKSIYWVRDSELNTYGFILNSKNIIRTYRLSYGSNTKTTNLNNSLNNTIIYETNGNQYTINGDTYKFNSNEVESLDYSIYIYGLNEYGTAFPFTAESGIRIYYFKIWDNGVLVRDFVPCYRKSDNIIGLFDMVNNVFYTNQGTGTFIKGNNTYKTESQTLTYGTASNLRKNTLTKEGYRFVSWNTKADGSGTSFEDEEEVLNLTGVDKDTINLYAQWEYIDYTIRFNSNGGIGSINDLSLSYNQNSNLRKNTFTREGYRFIEWNTKADGSGTSYEDEEEVLNLTNVDKDTINLYAQWEPFTYSIVYNSNGGSRLPNGYQEVEYIESNGTQYIDTGVKPTLHTDISLKCYVPFNSSNLKSIYWVRDSKLNTYGFILNSKNIIRTYRLSDGSNTITTNLNNSLNNTIIYETNGNQYTINGDTYKFDSNKVESLDYSIYIYGLNEYGTAYPFTAESGIRIYYFKIWDDDALVRDFVPCYRRSDNIIGLFDMVNNVFYTNQGTGTFIKGNDIDKTESQTLTYGTASNLRKNTFTNEGYRFVSWNTKADGSGTSYEDEEEVLNLTSIDGDTIDLYAIWEEDE